MKNWINHFMNPGSRRRTACLDPDAYARIFLKGSSREEKFKLLDHVFSCAECGNEFIGLKEIWTGGRNITQELETGGILENRHLLVKSAGKELKALKSKRRSIKNVFLLPKTAVAFASGVFLIALVSSLVFLGRPDFQEVVRSSNSGDFEVFSPLNPVSSSSIQFRWAPIPNTRTYTLEVLDKGLELVYKKENIESESFVPSDEDLSEFIEGQTYFWKVVSILNDGQTLESEFGKFEILSR